MDTIIDDAFCAHASKVIAIYEHTKDFMHAVDVCASDKVSRNQWKSALEKRKCKIKRNLLD